MLTLRAVSQVTTASLAAALEVKLGTEADPARHRRMTSLIAQLDPSLTGKVGLADFCANAVLADTRPVAGSRGTVAAPKHGHLIHALEHPVIGFPDPASLANGLFDLVAVDGKGREMQKIGAPELEKVLVLSGCVDPAEALAAATALHRRLKPGKTSVTRDDLAASIRDGKVRPRSCCFLLDHPMLHFAPCRTLLTARTSSFNWLARPTARLPRFSLEVRVVLCFRTTHP